MRIQIKNLGVLKQAEFSPGDMTIICGNNNTGKTYATYAFFGFLSLWREMVSIHIDGSVINRLLADGAVGIDVTGYIADAAKILSDGCRAYEKQLSMVFASPEERFKETGFQVTLDSTDIRPKDQYETFISSASAKHFAITKSTGSTELMVTLLVEKEKIKIPPNIIKHFIGDALKEVLFGDLFPKPFIASAERTGAAIFSKELNFQRNRMMEKMSKADKNIDPVELLLKVYKDYALPVKTNVEFTRTLDTIAKSNSFITGKHPDVLADFAGIIGGEYTVSRNDELFYVPSGKRVRLSMDESSSAVRSLLDIGFYLRHVAAPGDLLMVDEPELDLHPENQRCVARLFARLVNLGIKIFITTHSDYIIKELNTLIMLNRGQSHLRQIAQREGYKKEELLSPGKIKVYIAEAALVKLEEGQRRTRCQTLTPAGIDPELGIEARSFDTTIETMNRIQEEIVWGEE